MFESGFAYSVCKQSFLACSLSLSAGNYLSGSCGVAWLLPCGSGTIARLGWYIGEVPHGLLSFTAFPPEVEHARDRAYSHERGGPRTGDCSGGAGGWAALGRYVAGAEEQGAGDPRKCRKGMHQAPSQGWAYALQEVGLGPGGWRAAVAVGKALEAKVGRCGQHVQGTRAVLQPGLF